MTCCFDCYVSLREAIKNKIWSNLGICPNIRNYLNVPNALKHENNIFSLIDLPFPIIYLNFMGFVLAKSIEFPYLGKYG